MNKITQVGLSLIAILAILLLLVYGLGAVSDRFQTGENPLLRFVFVIVGLLVAFVIYFVTRDNPA
ncbi:MAG: hypothetical protein EHJ95_07680, partial [Methanobacteriota archaeon]